MEENQTQMDMFDELAEDKSITVEQLDKAVSDMAAAKADYEAKKKTSNEADAVHKEKKAQLISLLKAANKLSYKLDGVGTVSVTEKLKIKTPKTSEEKEAFFNYLREKYGEEGYLAYASVNYASVNTIYNDAFDEAKANGTADDFSIPGLGVSEAEFNLSFRKN